MEAFLKRQIFYSPMVFLEKTLPKEGEIVVKVGDRVAPFDILAHTYVSLSHKSLRLPPGAKVLVDDGETVAAGQVLARKNRFIGAEVLRAPHSGRVKISEDKMNLKVFSSPERFNLVSGIEAKVAKIVPKLSLLLQAPATLVQGVWGLGPEVVGELQVLEETSRLSLSRGLGPESVGKIIVCPGFVNDIFLQKAKALQVAGVVGAAFENKTDRSFLTVLVTEGFGKAVMPQKLARSLKRAELKTAVISPARRQLIIPDYREPGATLTVNLAESREVAVGDRIQILNWPYFSEEAVVEERLGETLFESGIRAESLRVKRAKNGEVIKIPASNVVLLD